MDLSHGLKSIKEAAGGTVLCNKKEQARSRSRRVRVIDFGTDPMALGIIAEEFRRNPPKVSTPKEDFERIVRGLAHLKRGGSRANLLAFLEGVDFALEFHGYDSEFGRAVKEKFGEIRHRIAYGNAARLLPNLSLAP